MALAPSFSANLPNKLRPGKHSLASRPAPVIFHEKSPLSFPVPNTASTHVTVSPSKLLDTADSGIWRTRVSFFPGFLTKRRDAKSLKEELYATIGPLDRGAGATPEDQQRVEQIARKLEDVNEIKEPLKSNLLNGKWELIYTTSQSVLQTQFSTVTSAMLVNTQLLVAVMVDTYDKDCSSRPLNGLPFA